MSHEVLPEPDRPTARKPSGAGWAVLVLATLFGLLGTIATLAAILLAFFAVQATDSVEHDTMYAFALVFALPTALISFGLCFWFHGLRYQPDQAEAESSQPKR